MNATGLWKRLVISRLTGLNAGQLTLIDGPQLWTVGDGAGPAATIEVRDPRFYRAIALGGHLGAAEGYGQGWWSCPDLTAVIQLMARNRESIEGLERGPARLLIPVRRLALWFSRNTRQGSRKNITAHYDLGNEFFAAFLDDTLTYSAGIFEDPEASMREASIAKYDRLCRKLDLQPQDRVIEIGSGWGGFAIYAAATYGCQVTTTTISAEQHQLALARVTAAGLADRVSVLFQDYRDLTGTFDKLVSIEMIEAVGHEFYQDYFATCARLLTDDGMAAIQAITIQDRFYDSARREMDFIKRYIFPGSCIPSISTLAWAARDTPLRMVQLEDLTPHYAETLARWRMAFELNWSRIAAMGFDDEFRRLWRFYFCYCEGGFREAVIGSVQLIFAMPRAMTHVEAGAVMPVRVAA
ncbi:MAG: cyclopropane-fatty-acyl-phospholipid synthase family protein [Gemmatimonadota bacterium]